MDDKGEWVIDERFVTSSGKMLLLDRMLKVLHAHGHKVLVLFQMTLSLSLSLARSLARSLSPSF
jgi:hypothetical protein